MARGLAVYPMGGTIDGTRGDHVLLAPPYIVEAGADRHHRRAAWGGGGRGAGGVKASTATYLDRRAQGARDICYDN